MNKTNKDKVLDYASGEARVTADQPGLFERGSLTDPQDVGEYWAVTWSQNDNAHQPAHEAGTGLDLGVEWHRDVLRAKLVSLRLPKRLLIAYKEQTVAQIEKLEMMLKQQ